MSRVAVRLSFALRCLLATQAAFAIDAHQGIAAFSQQATAVWMANERRPVVRAVAPDGESQVVFALKSRGARDRAEDPFQAEFLLYGRCYRTDIGSLTAAEVLWSPDSKAFALTYSDGDVVGNYHLVIYWATPSGFRIQDLTPALHKRARRWRKVCDGDDPTNVGAICWRRDYQRIVIGAEVPNHSVCPDMGSFRAYEVELPSSRIVQEWPESAARRLFAGALGTELARQ